MIRLYNFCKLWDVGVALIYTCPRSSISAEVAAED